MPAKPPPPIPWRMRWTTATATSSRSKIRSEYRVPSFRQMSVECAARHHDDQRVEVDLADGSRRGAGGRDSRRRSGRDRHARASSGKYVFSTIHTRDVASTVTALRDLHIDNRSLAGNLTGIISQRLVRRAGNECRRNEPISEKMAQFMRDEGVDPPESVAAPSGCQKCRNTGYYERVGVFEAVLPDREIREAIGRGDGEDDLRDMLRGPRHPQPVGRFAGQSARRNLHLRRSSFDDLGLVSGLMPDLGARYRGRLITATALLADAGREFRRWRRPGAKG